MTNFNNKEYLYHPVPGETTRQTVERNYYKYVAPQNQTPTPWSNPYNLPQPDWNDVVMSAIVGTGQGLQSAVSRALNAGTLGLYGATVDATLGNAYTNQQKYVQNLAEQEGLGAANKLANTAIDVGSQLGILKLLGL
jgi:hypothetical protein